ncbi:MAG: hypothetical protein WDW36_003674 [Sanguina aurantia]
MHVAEFQHCDLLTPSLVLHWSVANGSITMGLEDANWTQGPGQGSHWLGLGLSEGGSMAGADMMVLIKGPPAQPQPPSVTSQSEAGDGAGSSSGGAGPSAAWTVQDMHSYANGAIPRADAMQDVKLMGQPVEAGGRLLAVMRRPLQTCDADDRAIVQGMWTHVIWARGSRWPSYHGAINRGSSVLTLHPFANQTDGSQTAADAAADHDLKTFNLTMPNVAIPSVNVTNYMCSHVEVPVSGKQHIVRYLPVVQNPRLVHHMILFSCSSPPNATGDLFLCPRMDEGCQTFTIGWAPGIKSVELPAAAGYPVGGASTRFFSLQVHYNNMEHVSGLRDSSGFQVSVTPHLRPHDMGIISLGETNLTIPPGVARVEAPINLCPAACLARLAGPTTVWRGWLHMHELGSEMQTRHTRNTTELPPLGSQRYYEFNYQGGSAVAASSELLLPGSDALLSQCIYNSLSREVVTHAGEDTQSEMCFNFLSVYPAPTAIEVCESIGTIGPLGPLAICSTQARMSHFHHNGGFKNASLVAEFLASKDLVPAVQPVIDHSYGECPGLGTRPRQLEQ